MGLRRDSAHAPGARAQLLPPRLPGRPGDVDRQSHTNPWHQISTIGRRQLRLIVANRGYFIFLALLPFIVGLLPLAVAGDAGLGKPSSGAAPLEQKQILGMMNFGAFFMGTALTVRELVGERSIFRHEQAVGLSTSAYLAAKIAVFGAIAVIQSAILVLIVTIGKGALPDANLLGSPTLELFVGIAATCVASAILGLLVSSLAQTNNQVLPLTVVTLMAQIVFAGGMIPMTDRALDPVSWLIPSRWGLAATASTADVTSSSALIPQDSHWRHTASAWTARHRHARRLVGVLHGVRAVEDPAQEAVRFSGLPQETSAYRSTVSGTRASRRASTCARSSGAEVVLGSTGAPMLTRIGAGE